MQKNVAHADNRVLNLNGIEGLSLLRAAIDRETAERIVRNLTTERWQRWRHWRPFSRQDFGFEYDISSRNVNATTAIPEEIQGLFPALREAGWTGSDPTQVIVTRYPDGGSLGTHIDSPVFGPEVAGISLQTEWPHRVQPAARREAARNPAAGTLRLRDVRTGKKPVVPQNPAHARRAADLAHVPNDCPFSSRGATPPTRMVQTRQRTRMTREPQPAEARPTRSLGFASAHADDPTPLWTNANGPTRSGAWQAARRR